MDKTLIQKLETCSCCNGKGYKPTNNLVLYEFCEKCKGKGVVDWVTNIVPCRGSCIDRESVDLNYKFKQHNIQELIRRISTEYMEIGVTVSVEIKNQDRNKFETIHYQYQSDCLSIRKEF